LEHAEEPRTAHGAHPRFLVDDDDLDAVAERLHGIRESVTRSTEHVPTVIELAGR
jgi:tetrahydromethanopterin S-methyltransferase subunit G